ncbi:hypothetical protein MMC29_008368 [Sticta canariensis]|nr:hypothetical protein [Sticta canariensis]
MLGAKSTVVLAFLAISAQLAVAAPPACLLAAVNTEDNPADVALLCGAHSSNVQDQIKKLCGNDVQAALDAYKDTCKSAGKTITAESSSSSSTSAGSSSASSINASSASTTEESSASAMKSTSASGTVSRSGSSPSASVTDSESGSSPSATASVSPAPYPITYTSTYYDTECSCTKTTEISSSVVIGSSGFASATGSGGLAAPTGSLGSGPGSSATGVPILPSGTKTPGSPGSTSSPPPFPGSASKNLGSFGAAILAVACLAFAL